MYVPKHFQMTDQEDVYELINKHSFATLVSKNDVVPFATHLPLTLSDDQQYLIGHFARKNPHWQGLEGQQVLAIFQGPHCYISPTWYETDQAVPTWNYMVAHVTGTVEFVTDEMLHQSLAELICKYEDETSPYLYEKQDPEFLNNMSKGVVGFQIKIDQLVGKAKLSQNHPEERKRLVIDQLEKQPSDDERQIATYMRQHNDL
ncbi:transcriptional regulator [Bacillaceae bacterium JMAK1]|nr:transcriptional regulator [Bacillaceae bacterium JMAK1]